MSILAFGLNHSTAPLEVREKVSFASEVLPAALSELKSHADVEEAAILSTCNRTEVYCSMAGYNSLRPISWFSGFHGLRQTELQPFIYSHPNAAAVKHMLRVASGLDSMVLGEPQVLGQLKSAYQTAISAGSIGQLLGRLFQHSFKVAKEIRSNTAIGSHPVSVAFAAVRLAQQIFGDLSTQTALLIGAGETIELVAKHLHDSRLQRMIIANRTLERSQRLAGEYSAYAISLADLPQHLDEADIIISSTASRLPVLRKDTLASAIKKRKRRPIFIVDIAVPGDIETAAGELDDVYLYSVDDLKEVIEENIRSRREAARQAEEIINTQVVHFMDWLGSLDTVSTIRALRQQAAALQQDALDGALKKLRGGGNPEQVLREVTRSLTNKLIHQPSSQLRQADARRRAALLQAAQELFNLDGERPSTKKEP